MSEALPRPTFATAGDGEAVGAASEAWRLMSDLVLDNERRAAVADALGLSFAKTRALRRIALGPKTMREFAEMIGVDAPYLTLLVDDLEGRGLVERQPHPTDRRAKLLVATAAGQAMARLANEILGRPPEALDGLDPADLDALVGILRRASTPAVPFPA